MLHGDESGALSITSDKVRASSQAIAYQEVIQQFGNCETPRVLNMPSEPSAKFDSPLLTDNLDQSLFFGYSPIKLFENGELLKSPPEDGN